MLRHLLRPHPVPSLHYSSNLPAFYFASVYVCVCVCVTAMTQLWSRDYLGLMVLEEEDMKEEVTDLEQSTAGRELLNAIQHGGREQRKNSGLACEIAFVFAALTSYTDPATKTRLKQLYSLKNVLKKHLLESEGKIYWQKKQLLAVTVSLVPGRVLVFVLMQRV